MKISRCFLALALALALLVLLPLLFLLSGTMRASPLAPTRLTTSCCRVNTGRPPCLAAVAPGSLSAASELGESAFITC
ncbi:hypothetical protein V8F20_004097 [Naviculisporaceae sp. PSN 640]